jgi:hypothetical protein
MVTNRFLTRAAIFLFSAMLLFTCSPVNAAERANFNGIWQLVKDKSTNLPNIFETVDEYLLIIKQSDDKNISVATEFHGRGQTITTPSENFPVDGTPVEKDDQRGFKQKRSFHYADDQRHLLVETEKHFTGEVRLPDTNESESWELSTDGKILTITITPKTEGGQKQIRVFSKKTEQGV